MRRGLRFGLLATTLALLTLWGGVRPGPAPVFAVSDGLLMPAPLQFLDDSGVPVGGGKIYAYASGTTTPQATYSDVTLSTTNANPVVLDSAGRATIYLSRGTSYDFVLKTSRNVTVWTHTNVAVPSDVTPPAPAAVPTGAVVAFTGASAPSGYLLCQGQSVSRTVYAALFAVMCPAGVCTFGNGDGLTTFTLPDLRQRFPLGKADSGTGDTLGATGGAIDHTHTAPAHTHTVSRDGWGDAGTSLAGRLAVGVTGAPTEKFATIDQTSGSSGGSATTSANPPYQVLNFIVKTVEEPEADEWPLAA